MKNIASNPDQSSPLSMRECLAAWVVALALIAAMVAGSFVVVLFEGWM